MLYQITLTPIKGGKLVYNIDDKGVVNIDGNAPTTETIEQRARRMAVLVTIWGFIRDSEYINVEAIKKTT